MVKKKALFLALALAVCLLFGCTSKDLSGQCGQDLKWTYSNGTLTITGTGPMYDYGYPQPWSSVLDKITTISLPQGLTHIGSYAFSRCTRLNVITIPSSVTSIGDYAFSDCAELTSASIPQSVTAMGQGVFDGCTKLIMPVQQPQITAAPVDIPVQTEAPQPTPQPTAQPLSPAADSQCGADLSWTFSAATGRLTITGNGAMYDYADGQQPWKDVLDQITSLSLPEGLTSLGKGAFRDCTRIPSVTIPRGVTAIPERAFSGCTNLGTVEIPGRAVSIGDYAFYGCEGLQSVSLPSTVQSVGRAAFGGCLGLETVYYGGKEEQREDIAFGRNNDDLTAAVWRYSTVTGLSITQEPVDAVARNGELASFAVRTSGRVNSCQWYYRTGPKAKWVMIDSAITAVLTFTAKPSQDGYQYMCEIENDHGVLTTDVATLTMELYLPVIEIQPVDMEVNSGEKIKFTVTATDADAYQWYYRTTPKGKWNKTSNGEKASHTVTGKASRNGYQYYCEVSNADGKVASDIVTLTVIPQPPVITGQPQDVTVNSGEKASFTVTAEGNSLIYQWYYRKTATGEWTAVKNNSTSATLTLTGKLSNNGYQYRCKITNDDGKATSKTVTLTVILHPPVITAEPEDASIKVGEKAEFTVTAEGKDLTYQWSYRKTPTGEWTNVKTNGTAATLAVTGKAANDGYQYRCEVKNSDGTATSTIVNLHVEYHLPTITGQPESVEVKKGKKATFTVTAEDATGYQWYYRKSSSADWTKIKGAMEPTYSLTVETKHNGYQYKCDVSNADGTVASKTAKLKVK